MGRILNIFKDHGVTCLPSGHASIDYERFDEYLGAAEVGSDTAFESHPPAGDVRGLATHDQAPSILRYFLDGSRKTYKVADVIVGGRYLPVVAGQVGVAVVERDQESRRVAPVREFCQTFNVIALPDKIAKDDIAQLQGRLGILLQHPFHLEQYENDPNADPVDKAVAKIMDFMARQEISTVQRMAESGLLANDRVLVRDGPLQFGQKIDAYSFRNVIGLSKSFRPHLPVGKTVGRGRSRRDVGAITARLDFGQRTVALRLEVKGRHYGVWYLRIRQRERLSNPLDGVVKLERLAVDSQEVADGLDTSIIDTLSQHILRERNVTPFKADKRWSTHIYPVYLAEKFLKLSFMSDLKFTALF